MTVDLAAMSAAPIAAKGDPSTAFAVPSQYENFAHAWLRVKVLQVFAVGVIVVPGTAIALALSQEPTEEGGVWTWSVDVGASTIDLDVTAGLAQGWDVDLFVTNPNEGLDRFRWVAGDSNLAATDGTWMLHDPELPASNTEALAIEWNYVSDTDRSLAYVVRNTESPEFGDSLTLTIAGTTASLQYVDADSPSIAAEIRWDESGAGQIEVPGFNSGVAACWNTSFENTPCE